MVSSDKLKYSAAIRRRVEILETLQIFVRLLLLLKFTTDILEPMV
jgi:hypothetical protein